MRKLALFILFLCIGFSSQSQQYIVEESGDTIFCKIDTVIGGTIFYTDDLYFKRKIEIGKVKLYSNVTKSEESNMPPDLNGIQNQRLDSLFNITSRIQENLRLSHTNYRTGTGLIIAGIIANGLVAAYWINTRQQINDIDPSRYPNKIRQENKDLSDALLIGTTISHGLFGAGIIIQINSHRWIGRAGGYPEK